MSKIRETRVRNLAKESNREIDDTLIILWYNGFKEISGPEDRLVGKRLSFARRALLLPGKNELTSIDYWQRILKLSQDDLELLLLELDISISPQSNKLPKGAVKKLKSWRNKQSNSVNVTDNQIDSTTDITTDQYTQKKWEIIGHTKDIKKLSLENILDIHYELVNDPVFQSDPINPSGPRDENIIASAVYRQHTCMGDEDKYPTIEMCGAALIHSLIHDHPFHNGNKRTALVSLLVFLDRNDFMLTCDEDELFKFVLLIAQHKLIDKTVIDDSDQEVLAITKWILLKSRPIERGERPLSFRRLKQILTRYGCEFEQAANGKLKISRSIRARKIISYSKTVTKSIQAIADGKEIDRDTISSIRSELRLNEEKGVDSAAFYEDSPTSVSEFIVQYRRILVRLGKL